MSGWWTVALAAVAAGAAAGLYFAAGATHAYLIADDFQWLGGADRFSWDALTPGGRDHFFRPTTSLWFAGAVRVCGPSSDCHHALTILVHAVNVALLFTVVRLLRQRPIVAFTAALTFGVMPAFVPAVMWVSAITGLLASGAILTALVAQMSAWRMPQHAPWLDAVAVSVFAIGVFAHEVAATLPALSWIAHRMAAPAGHNWRRLGIGFAVVLALFVWATLTANRDNYVFREGHYAPGWHMVRNAFDYLVSIWVGPHAWWAFVLTAVVLATVATVQPLARFGVIWTLLTMVPYLGFTWANVGRYTYLPAMGFAIVFASAFATPRRLSRVAAAMLIAVVLRFAVFTYNGVRGDVVRFEAPRTYLNHVRALNLRPENGVIEVPAPATPEIDPQYVEVMIRWLYRDPILTVIVR